MADAHANFAYSLVATAPSPATSGTSLVVTAADGAKFPAVPFNATVWPAGAQPTTANAEIVRVTARSTDTLTITRTQESTSARSIVVGDQIEAGVTAKTLTDAEASPNAILQSIGTAKGDQIGFTGSATPVRHAIGADGTVQTADSAQSDGWKWGTPALASLRDTYLRPTALTYETMSRAGQINTAGTIVSGTLYLVGIALPKGAVISNITFVTAGTAATTPTHGWFGLYDSSRVQLAVTADQLTAAWASNTAKTLAIATVAAGAASSFTTTYEGLHYLGLMVVAATPPTFSIAQQAGGIGALTPVLTGSSTAGQTTPPAFPFTGAALTTYNAQFYAGAA